MYSSEELDLLVQEALDSLGIQNKSEGNEDKKGNYRRNKNQNRNSLNLTTAQALVIAGILGGSLSVFSVLVDANQEINIVLTGSLKKKDNNDKLDGILDQLGKVPFDDVVAAMVRRLR